MGFYSDYNDAFTQLKSTLEDVDSINQGVLGEQFKLHNLPLTIINPSYSRIGQLNIGDTLEVVVDCRVVVVVRETEPSDWFDEVINVMGDVMDVVLEDRSLSNTVLDTTPQEFTPGEVTFTNQLYYGGLIEFQFLLHYNPG